MWRGEYNIHNTHKIENDLSYLLFKMQIFLYQPTQQNFIFFSTSNAILRKIWINYSHLEKLNVLFFKKNKFFFFFFLLWYLNYLPIRAGAIKDKVDIFTAPNNDTKRSNQGTVAANPTVNIIIILWDPTMVQ